MFQTATSCCFCLHCFFCKQWLEITLWEQQPAIKCCTFAVWCAIFWLFQVRLHLGKHLFRQQMSVLRKGTYCWCWCGSHTGTAWCCSTTGNVEAGVGKIEETSNSKLDFNRKYTTSTPFRPLSNATPVLWVASSKFSTSSLFFFYSNTHKSKQLYWMPQLYKHKQNTHHKRASVWKGWPAQHLLFTAVSLCFVLTSHMK